MNDDQLQSIRHTLAHLLAAAVRQLYPGAKNAIGPAIDDGFYQDFDLGDHAISEDDLQKIEEKMRELLPQWTNFASQGVSLDEVRKEFSWNEYKIELAEELDKEGKQLTFQISGGFIDLCKGGHVERPATQIKPDAFRLDRIAGAYWRGDEKNKMLTRVYGLAFGSKSDLAAYLELRAEAEKRDHRKIGQQQDLFILSDLVGPGLPLFLPKGEALWQVVQDFVTSKKRARGYQYVRIPHIAKAALYHKSGHLGKYDAMMPIMTDQHGDEHVLKAMNCPHHFQLFAARPHSYRDLPLRLAENTTVYRNEKSGELNGLLRVKSITQDDTHHFVRRDQIQGEIEMVIGLMKEVYAVFGFTEFKVQISLRDPQKLEKYFGQNELWKQAEQILVDAVKTWGVEYVATEGEAAFYGPKIDIMVKDAIGRLWQLNTVQLDFWQAENFDLSYTAEDGSNQRPAVLHVAILGSFERFLGVLIEHYAGKWALWIAPVQVKLLPIADRHVEAAQGVANELKKAGYRVELDDRQESVGKKIRAAQLEQVPYMLVLGDKEIESNQVAVRHRDTGDLGVMGVDKFMKKLQSEPNPLKD